MHPCPHYLEKALLYNFSWKLFYIFSLVILVKILDILFSGKKIHISEEPTSRKFWSMHVGVFLLYNLLQNCHTWSAANKYYSFASTMDRKIKKPLVKLDFQWSQ